MLDIIPSSMGMHLHQIAGLVIVAAIAFFLARRWTHKPSSQRRLPEDLPLVGALRFFTARWDFLQSHSRNAWSGGFQFHVGHRRTVGLYGTQARKVFFEDRRLNNAEGYAILFGKTPGVRNSNTNDVPIDQISEKDILASSAWYSKYFNNRVLKIIHPEQIERHILPRVLQDVTNAMPDLERDHSQPRDPFGTIYMLLYQSTIRSLCCNEVADDRELSMRLLKMNRLIDRSTTASSIILPQWIPLVERLGRLWGGLRVYLLMNTVIQRRLKEGRKDVDALQVLLDHGDSTQLITRFVLTALYSAEVATGLMVTYTVCFLAQNQEWMMKAREEVMEVAIRHSNPGDRSILDSLRRIAFKEWLQEFPVLDVCLHETMRLLLIGTMFRWNRSKDEIEVGEAGDKIPPGSFVVYHFNDVHRNEQIYSQPEVWDPARFLEPRSEHRRSAHAFAGWGGGNHPCLGKRIAKLTSNIVLAFILSVFDAELTDETGDIMRVMPAFDLNGISLKIPEHSPFRIKLSRRTPDAC